MQKALIFLIGFIFISQIAWAVVEAGNKLCLVSPEDKVSGKHFAEYQGKKYGLCCNRCAAKFNKDPEKYLKNETA